VGGAARRAGQRLRVGGFLRRTTAAPVAATSGTSRTEAAPDRAGLSGTRSTTPASMSQPGGRSRPGCAGWGSRAETMAEIFDRASTIMAEEGVAGRSRPGWVSAVQLCTSTSLAS
jgi:hypothetical protein